MLGPSMPSRSVRYGSSARNLFVDLLPEAANTLTSTPVTSVQPLPIPLPAFKTPQANNTTAWMSHESAGAAEVAQLKAQVKRMSNIINKLKESNDDTTDAAAHLYHESVKRGAAVDGLVTEVAKVEKFLAGLKLGDGKSAAPAAPKPVSTPSSADILASMKSKSWTPHATTVN